MERLVEFLLYQQGSMPYWIAFFVLLGCGFGIPIPEDIILFAMGILAYMGLVDFKTSVVVCLAGVMIGDITIFLAGRFYGKKLLKKKFFSKIFTPQRMDVTKSFFVKWGNKIIFAARFMPGFRAPVFFSSGVFKVPFVVFVFYDGLAALLSVPIFIGAFYYFGDVVENVLKYVRAFEHGMIILIMSFTALMIIRYFYKQKKKKRRKS